MLLVIENVGTFTLSGYGGMAVVDQSEQSPEKMLLKPRATVRLH
jgi:hypothetical protein